MQINLAPWYYRKLLGNNQIIEAPEFYNVVLLDGKKYFETSVALNEKLRPSWYIDSALYRNTDGSGTSKFKNIAVYKGISEALERWAFYETVDIDEQKYAYDLNPTTTGMAAYPHFSTGQARENAKAEAIERWAIHEFNRKHLPVKECISQIPNLRHFEIETPFNDVKVSLLEYWNGTFFCYGFAGGLNLKHSFERALVELDRNLRVLLKTVGQNTTFDKFESTIDRTLFFFSTLEGNQCFRELISNAPLQIFNTNPKTIRDLEVQGEWSKYTKVWRYLLEDSYFDYRIDHKFFMF